MCFDGVVESARASITRTLRVDLVTPGGRSVFSVLGRCVRAGRATVVGLVADIIELGVQIVLALFVLVLFVFSSPACGAGFMSFTSCETTLLLQVLL